MTHSDYSICNGVGYQVIWRGIGRWHALGLRRAGPVDLPPRTRVDSHPAGGLPVPRPARGRDLRRQGEEPPRPALVVLPGHRRPPPAHGHDGHQRGGRRLDGRQHRGRGAPARVLLDQGVRPALQREVPRRQVLPVAGGDLRRRVPAGDGRARGQAPGHPLLRPLLPRLGDPRDRRPAAAGVPDEVVQQRRVQALQPDRPALPARLHRQVLRAVRRPGDRAGAPRDRRRLLRLHGRQHERVRQARRAADVRRVRPAGLREGGPAARRPRRPQPGAGEAAGGARRRHQRRRARPVRGPARGRHAGVLRAQRPDQGPARLGGRPRRGQRHRRAGRRLPAPAVRR